MGIGDLHEYLDAERIRRRRGLNEPRRRVIWKVLEGYLSARKAASIVFGWNDIASAVLSNLDVAGHDVVVSGLGMKERVPVRHDGWC